MYLCFSITDSLTESTIQSLEILWCYCRECLKVSLALCHSQSKVRECSGVIVPTCSEEAMLCIYDLFVQEPRRRGFGDW